MTPHGNVGAGDLAKAALALRLPVVQRQRSCATTASATARRTGRPAPRSASSRRRRGRSRRPATAACPVGDASCEHGGNIPLHETHEVGLDVDVRPIRDAENQCTWGTNWRFASYDRAATRTLIKTIRAAAPGHVKLIYFNDPVLIREGLTTWFSGHDDHLHIRYCETGRYPIARVPLLSASGQRDRLGHVAREQARLTPAEHDVGRAVDRPPAPTP